MTTYHKPASGLLSVSDSVDSIKSNKQEIYDGLVMDIVLDHTHKYHKKEGYDVGTIIVKIFGYVELLDGKNLPPAYPFDTTVQEYPLIGEMVTLYKIRGAFFYNRKVPIARRVQENSAILTDKRLNALGNPKKITDFIEADISKHKFGQYFKPDSRVRPLKHFEGDTLFQGRMGQSIRFGSSAMDPSTKGLAPNIILRAGQAKDAEKKRVTSEEIFGLTLEDINNDASSIWMVSNQNLPFEPSTVDAGSFYRSISNPPQKFDKATIVANSDRIILNAKNTHIMMFATEEIYMNSLSRISLDTDESIHLTANNDVKIKSSRDMVFIADELFSVTSGKDMSFISLGRFSFTSKKIHLGGIENDVEPIVGGTSLSIFLARFILALMGMGAVSPQIIYQQIGSPVPTTVVPPAVPGVATFSHVLTPLGPGVLNPAIIAGLTTLYTELIKPNPGSSKPIPFSGAPFNSFDAFVGMANEDAILGVELNDFTDGEKINVPNNDWKLSDNYYRVV